MCDSGRVLVKSPQRELGRLQAGQLSMQVLHRCSYSELPFADGLYMNGKRGCFQQRPVCIGRRRPVAGRPEPRCSVVAPQLRTVHARAGRGRPLPRWPPVWRGYENKIPAALESIRRLMPRAQLPGVSGLVRRLFQSTCPASRLLGRPCKRPLSRWPPSTTPPASGRGDPAQGLLAQRRFGAAQGPARCGVAAMPPLCPFKLVADSHHCAATAPI